MTVGGIVLCGGRSTRMGQPKLSLPFGEELLLQRMVRILSEVVTPVVVVAAPDQKVPCLPSDIALVRDREQGLGPLGGISIGLDALRDSVEAAYVSACDVPLLKTAFIRTVIDSLQGHELAIPKDERHYHPLAAVYRTSLADRALSLLAAGRMRPLFLVEESDSRILGTAELRKVDPQLDSLRNVNSLDEYQRALRDAFPECR